MRRENKKRNKIIIGLISLLLLMTVGYAAFQTNLNIKGTSKISSNWDIRITNVTSGNKTGNAENAKTPTWTNLTASMEANLYEKGDAMEYEVTVENKGTFDAKLENILTNIKSNNEAIKISFSGYTKGEKLYKNTTKTVNVKIEYNKDYEGTPPTNSSEVEITLDYGQAEGGTITPTNDYLVTYDYKTNGGTSSTSQSEYLSEGSKIDLSYTATKAGWTFAGWNTNKDATVGLSTIEMKNADVTLYAIYKKTINVSYTKGTGISAIGKTTDSCTMWNRATTCQITLPSITSLTGYGVDGWYNSSNTKVGTEGTKVNVNTDKTTYTAKGKANSYTLTYNYNGATGGNSTTSKAVTYNSTYGTLPSPTRSYVVTYNYNSATSGNTTANATSNYTFNGWYKESTFTNQVTSSTIYNTVGNLTIYAKWTGTSIVLPTPTRTGYTFSGWYSDSSLTNKVGNAGSSYTPTSSLTLYAKWTINSYNVTYDYKTNGGTTSTKTTATVNYGSSIDLSPTATKAGWTFVGWNTNKDATTGLTSLNMSTSNVTLYAIYRKEAVTLTAKFNGNGATLSSTSNLTCTLPAVYNNASQQASCKVTAPTITRSGYNIIGYNTASGSTTNNSSYNASSKVLTLTSSNNNSTWYAITSKTITITFNKNGASTQTNGSGTAVSDTTVTRTCSMYNTSTTCNVTSPTIVGASGFSVVGYNTASGSTTSAWNHNTAKAVSANATYYAVTKSTSAYTASFNANGATSVGSSSLSCYRYNGSSSCTVTAPSITRSGFTITGWNTTASATTSSLNVGATLTLTSNPTYYAITKKVVTMTYAKDSTVSAVGATSGTCTIQNTATACAVTLPTITPLTGYTTLGWYNGTTKVGNASSSVNVSSNITYTAKASDVTKPTISLSPNTQTTYVSGGKAVTVTLADSGSGLKASQPIYYAWSTSNATVPSSWSSITSTNTAGAKSATVTVPATSNSSLTGTYYLWIKAGTLSDVSGNTSNQVVSALFKFDNTNPTVSVSTSKTTKSITAVATASAISGISKYEFSKDNGATWVANGTNKTYTFSGLTHNTTYPIKVRVTSGVGKQTTTSATVMTNKIDAPTYSQVHTSTGKTVTITYPSGCGSTYTCTYIKDGGTPVTVTSTTAAVAFTASGNVVAKVSDGTNTVTASTYTVNIITSTITVNSTLGGSVTVANITKGTSVTSSNATKKTITAINGDSIKVTTSLKEGFEIYSLKKNSTNIDSGYTEIMGSANYSIMGIFKMKYLPFSIGTALDLEYNLTFNDEVADFNQEPVQLWSPGGRYYTEFKGVENNIVYYGIQNYYFPNKYIQVRNTEDVLPGSQCTIYDWVEGETDFYWYLEDAGSGYFYIVNKTGYCMEVANGVAHNGSYITVNTCDNTIKQQWKFST